jgi:phosphoribosylformylglycinamidine cyclo-ligase
MNYAESGVDIEKEESGIDTLTNWTKRTIFNLPGDLIVSDYFASVIRIPTWKGERNGIDIVFTNDGVGTKILVSKLLNDYTTIGIDLVAMNVNDIVCVGAKPVAMLDYIAIGKIDNNIMSQIGYGLAGGAADADVAVVGGETASLADIVGDNIDLSASCIGLVSTGDYIDGSTIELGDLIIGLGSSGLHSNGYTLARKLTESYNYDDYIPELQRTLGEELLEPTRIYSKCVWEVLNCIIGIRGIAHITGGGFRNILRFKTKEPFTYQVNSLPESKSIFNFLQKLGKIDDEEMYKTFNMGVGMVIVADYRVFGSVASVCAKYDIPSFLIGEVKSIRGDRSEVCINPLNLMIT